MAPALKTRFGIEYKKAGNCLPKDVVFKLMDFVRPNAVAQPLPIPQVSVHAILDITKDADAELIVSSNERSLVIFKD